MCSCSKGPKLDYRDILRVSSYEPETAPPPAPLGPLLWMPPMPTPSTSTQQESAEPTHHCQIAFLSTEDRVQYSNSYLNRCNNCDARVFSYCYPRCYLRDDSDDPNQKNFYCLSEKRNCFDDTHAIVQLDNRIPVHCTISRCHKCKSGSSRFKCNKCNKRFCLLNGKQCFYSSAHLEDCRID